MKFLLIFDNPPAPLLSTMNDEAKLNASPTTTSKTADSNENHTSTSSTQPIVIKILIVGEYEAGLNEFASKFVSEPQSTTSIATNVDFKLKTIEINNQEVLLQIFTTTGTVRFELHTTKGANGLLLLYNIEDEITLLNLKNWIPLINNYYLNVPKLLAGHYFNIGESQRKVDYQSAKKFADDHSLLFFNTLNQCTSSSSSTSNSTSLSSVKNKKNDVDGPFYQLATLILNDMKKPNYYQNTFCLSTTLPLHGSDFHNNNNSIGNNDNHQCSLM